MSPPSHRHELYTVAQVRALDRRAIEVLGVPGFELMRRAAWAALASLRRHWPQARRIAVHCGPGNNGGDGFLLATLAREAGLRVDVLALGDASPGDAALARQAWKDAGGVVRLWQAGDALPGPRSMSMRCTAPACAVRRGRRWRRWSRRSTPAACRCWRWTCLRGWTPTPARCRVRRSVPPSR
jgi:hypothetical protein